MLIDKMDQAKMLCPAIWSQLATTHVQDQEKRFITGLLGSMWFGTTGACIRSSALAPGSYIIMAAPSGTTSHGQEVLIVVGQVVDTSCKRDMVVACLLPHIARVKK